ncbi:19099_t:CDS:2, partial [Gigaspora margarita]
MRISVYADTEVDSAGQERKRLRTNENDKVAIKGGSPIITSNIRDPTQSEPNKQRTLENQKEPSSRMVLRKQKKGFYDKSSDSDDYVKNLSTIRIQDQNDYVHDKPVSHHDYNL